MNKIDCMVYIGRFQPFHKGHANTVNRALEQAEKVLILVGSSNRSRSTRNTWLYTERAAMIRAAYPDANRVVIAPLADVLYDASTWVSSVKAAANEVCPKGRIGLIGHYKDATSWYLESFPDWEQYPQPIFEKLHATDVRKMLFEQGKSLRLRSEPDSGLANMLPAAIVEWLSQWRERFPQVWADMQTEAKAERDQHAKWAMAPYPPVFVTVDAVVKHEDKVLVITRSGHPGKGQLALPGGFLEQKETLESGALRELREETGLELGPGNIVAGLTFDHPERSTRGRTITHAYLMLVGGKTAPILSAGDDAATAEWLPIADFLENPTMVFEDHWFIVKSMLGAH